MRFEGIIQMKIFWVLENLTPMKFF